MNNKQPEIKGADYLYWFAEITFPFRSLVTRFTSWLFRKRDKRLIFVFGINRSGTSMLGEFLSFAGNSMFIHEPVKQIFQYDHKRKKTDQPLWEYVAGLPDSKKVYYLTCTALWYGFKSSGKTKIICMKIVLANVFLKSISIDLPFAEILYISRHPCGRTESMIRQRSIIENEKEPYSLAQLENIARHWAERIEEIQRLFTRHPEWVWIIFEELTQNPTEEFRKLYKKLGLHWSDDIHRKIEELTSSVDGSFFETRRDSKAQANKWKNILTAGQVEAIRKGSKRHPTNLYEGF